MRRRHFSSPSACSTDLDFSWPKNLNPYPAQPATGVLGRSPKRVLLTFARTKVSPRRVGVLIKPFIRPALPAGVQIMIPKRLAPPQATANFYLNCPAAGDYKLYHDRRRASISYFTTASDKIPRITNKRLQFARLCATLKQKPKTWEKGRVCHVLLGAIDGPKRH